MSTSALVPRATGTHMASHSDSSGPLPLKGPSSDDGHGLVSEDGLGPAAIQRAVAPAEVASSAPHGGHIIKNLDLL